MNRKKKFNITMIHNRDWYVNPFCSSLVANGKQKIGEKARAFLYFHIKKVESKELKVLNSITLSYRLSS